MRLRVLATGETGTVVHHEPGGDCLLALDGGGTLVVGPKEKVQLLLPGWSLTPPQTA